MGYILKWGMKESRSAAMAYAFDERKPGRVRVLVAIEADEQALDFAMGEDKRQATLSLVIAAANRDSGMASRSYQTKPAPKESGRLLPVIGAHRAFKAMGRLSCRFQVFGASKDPKDGAPKVDASYTLRRAGGKVREAAPSLIAVAPDGPVMRLIGLSVDGMPDGDYELVLHLVDETSGRSV
jgi:hypothetical protein